MKYQDYQIKTTDDGRPAQKSGERNTIRRFQAWPPQGKENPPYGDNTGRKQLYENVMAWE